MKVMRNLSKSRLLQENRQDSSASLRSLKQLAPPTRELLLPSFHIDEIRLGRQINLGKYTATFELSSIIQNHKADNMRHQWARDYLIDNKDGRRKRRNNSTGVISSIVGNDSHSGNNHHHNHHNNDKQQQQQQRLCIKFIRREFMEQDCSHHADFEGAATNLANDAQMMSALNHKNIAKLRGSSIDGTEAYYKTGRHDGYFLIVDRISETLDDKLARWRTRNNWIHLKKRIVGCATSSSITTKAEKEFLIERLQCAYDLADAIEYMHEHGLAHMNLNEYTVGFNAQGVLQVYELGDAVPISSSSAVGSSYYYCNSKAFSAEDETRRMPRQDSSSKSSSRRSGNTIMMGGGQDQQDDDDDEDSFKADDVAAFTRLLCELLVLRPKLKKGLPPSITHLHEGNATIRAFRKLARVIPSELLQLLQRGLSTNNNNIKHHQQGDDETTRLKRPSMSEYRSVLGNVLSSLDSENSTTIIHHHHQKVGGGTNPRKTQFMLATPLPSGFTVKQKEQQQHQEEDTFHSSFEDSFRVSPAM